MIFNIVFYHLLFLKLGFEYQTANLISWFVTVLLSYIVNKLFVFNSSSVITLKEIALFFGSRICSLVVELIILFILYDWLKFGVTSSKIASHGTALIINYFLSKILFLKKDSA